MKIHVAITSTRNIKGVEYVEGTAFKFDPERAIGFATISSRFFQMPAAEAMALDNVEWHESLYYARRAAGDDALSVETTIITLEPNMITC